MTAHPKICPETGELLAFSYFSFEQPFLTYHRINSDGQLIQSEGIEIPNMVMMHDFNVTRNYVIFMDLPLVLNLSLLETVCLSALTHLLEHVLESCQEMVPMRTFVGLKLTLAMFSIP